MILLIDLSLWFFIRGYRKGMSKSINFIFSTFYWTIPIVFIAFFAYLGYDANGSTLNEKHYYFFTMMNGALVLLYLPKTLMVVWFIISLLVTKVKHSTLKRKSTSLKHKGKQITRAQFLGKMSLVIAAIPFTGIIYNITKGRFRFAVNSNNISIRGLPQALKGLRIIQLSDLHLGNFNQRYDLLDGVVEHINELKPDLIVITGDLVNNFSSETNGWEKVFSKLNAKYGKYAVLGNHDYGDYSEWSSSDLKQANFNSIKQAYRDSGFKLLMNEHETIIINGKPISLIGTENWGHPPFAQYGKLSKAMQGDLSSVKILLTHNPDHWEAEVLKQTDIDLTLSGHTHGMQVGIRTKNMEWSPAKWKYKYWGGLYQGGDQFLYVNRGLGCVGIPLRIGMPPEVTLLELI